MQKEVFRLLPAFQSDNRQILWLFGSGLFPFQAKNKIWVSLSFCHWNRPDFNVIEEIGKILQWCDSKLIISELQLSLTTLKTHSSWQKVRARNFLIKKNWPNKSLTKFILLSSWPTSTSAFQPENILTKLEKQSPRAQKIWCNNNQVNVLWVICRSDMCQFSLALSATELNLFVLCAN